MASRFQIRTTIPTLAAAVCATTLLLSAPESVFAHQVTNVHGAVVPHQHAYKRSSYGNGYLQGHVAPTRHGNNMIIWSPAPTKAYGNTVPRMHITKPNRHSRLYQQRGTPPSPQLEHQRDQQFDQQLRQRRRDDR